MVWICIETQFPDAESLMNFIDAHSHIWTPDTQSYPLAGGYRRAQMEPPSFTVEELQAQMKPAGVNRAVLIQMSFYGHDNSYMTDTMAKFPGTFSGVAVIEQDVGNPAPEMLKLKKQGVRGFRIYPRAFPVEKWLSSGTMHGMWTVGRDERLAMCCLMDPNGLPALDKMCQHYPDTPVVIDHMCRIGVTGTIEEAEVAALCAMARHRFVTVKVSAFYALGAKKAPYIDLGPLIKRLLDAYGPERLMWASDNPYQVVNGHNYQDSINLIKSGLDFLSPTDKEWLLTKSAERVFFS
jgi:predicted TIM-barrel fold metal-dependent hydrolase